MVALCNCEVNGRRVKVFLKRLGGGEYLLLIGSFQPENLEKVYKSAGVSKYYFKILRVGALIEKRRFLGNLRKLVNY
jgi:hypothetical protein